MSFSVPPDIERIAELPVPAGFTPVLTEAVTHVLQHPGQYQPAAEIINAELAAKAEPDNDGNSYPPAFWLIDLLPQMIREGPRSLGAEGYADWARRLMLLTALATYPGDLSRFGTCGEIPWDHVAGSVDDDDDGDPLSLPSMMPGRSWILMESGNKLRDGMLDGGEHVDRRYELVNGQRFAVDVRTPGPTGLLGQLVAQLNPILAEVRRAVPPPPDLAQELITSLIAWGEHTNEEPYTFAMLDKAIAAGLAWGVEVGILMQWREQLESQPPEAGRLLRLLRDAAETENPAMYLRFALAQVAPIPQAEATVMLGGVTGSASATHAVDTSWLKVSQAAKESGINKGEISRACDTGAIHSVAKGRSRRIDPASFRVWKTNRARGAEVRAALSPVTASYPKAQVSSGMCDNCGATVTLKDGRGKCHKCKSTKIGPL